MEITRTLSITAEELFDQIEKSILSDIKEATGKDLTRESLNGFKYKKRARGGGKNGTPMDVKIKRYRYPEVYEVRFSYATGVNSVCYRVTEAGEGSVTLDYSEEVEVRGKGSQGIMGALNRKLYDARLRRGINQTLKAIEEMAVRERRARENNPALTELEEGSAPSNADDAPAGGSE